MLRAIEQGYVQREIQNAAYAYQRAVDAGEAVVVGVNRFADAEGAAETPVQRIDEELERRQVERVRGASGAAGGGALGGIAEGCGGGCEEWGEPDAAAGGGGGGERDRGGDCGHAARRVWRVPGVCGGLICKTSEEF